LLRLDQGFHPDNRIPDVHYALVKINVLPTKAQNFTSPEPIKQTENNSRLDWFIFQDSKK